MCAWDLQAALQQVPFPGKVGGDAGPKRGSNHSAQREEVGRQEGKGSVHTDQLLPLGGQRQRAQ